MTFAIRGQVVLSSPLAAITPEVPAFDDVQH
jgi:hypothetical protein